jgi:hypothetical protein
VSDSQQVAESVVDWVDVADVAANFRSFNMFQPRHLYEVDLKREFSTCFGYHGHVRFEFWQVRVHAAFVGSSRGGEDGAVGSGSVLSELYTVIHT